MLYSDKPLVKKAGENSGLSNLSAKNVMLCERDNNSNKFEEYNDQEFNSPFDNTDEDATYQLENEVGEFLSICGMCRSTFQMFSKFCTTLIIMFILLMNL